VHLISEYQLGFDPGDRFVVIDLADGGERVCSPVRELAPGATEVTWVAAELAIVTGSEITWGYLDHDDQVVHIDRLHPSVLIADPNVDYVLLTGGL
jgi:hypothetical protein